MTPLQQISQLKLFFAPYWGHPFFIHLGSPLTRNLFTTASETPRQAGHFHYLSVTQTVIVCVRFDLSNNNGSLFSQAVQIIVGLFHFALGILCSQLFLEDGNAGIGSLPVLIVLTYAFCSTPFVSKP